MWTVGDAAAAATRVLSADSTALGEAWRFGILQVLDDYERARRAGGTARAAALFAEAPPPTGDCRVDAAQAALAEHLARRDGWTPPRWAFTDDRYAQPWWFVSGLVSWHATALVQSPAAFRKRGVFITDRALDRV